MNLAEAAVPKSGTPCVQMFKVVATSGISIVAVLLFVPFAISGWAFPNIDSMSVDAAFVLALPQLFVDNAQYGPDVVFTYGPWGFVMSDIGPSNVYLMILAFRISFTLIMVQAFSDLIRVPNPLLSKALTVSLIGLTYLWFRGPDQGLWFAPSLYLLIRFAIADDGRRTSLGLAFGGLVAFLDGWTGLVKFNLFVFGAIVVAAAMINDVRFRRFPFVSLSWVAGLATGWLAAGQHIVNFPMWVARCFDLSMGYADAMSKGFVVPYSWSKVSAFYCGMIAFMSAALVAGSVCKSKWSRCCLFGAMAIFCYSALQHSMGGNQIEQANGELLTALWFLSACVARNYAGIELGKKRGAVTCGLILVAVVINVSIVKNSIRLFGPAKSISKTIKSQFQAARALAFEDSRRPEANWNSILASISESMPVPADFSGSADIYPQHTGVIIAQPKLRFSPRPAYLSLNAHTQSLAEINAEYLRHDGPDLVLFQVLHPSRVVHHRHPATDDGPSWPELLSRYNLEGWATGKLTASDFAILKRRERPLSYRLESVLDQDVAWNDFVSVPQDKLAWLSFDVRQTQLGRVVKTVYKPPHVLIELFDGDAIVDRYQIVPGLGQAGFLVSPHIDTTERFAALFTDESVSSAAKMHPVQERKRITRFRLQTESGTEWFWTKEIRVRLSELVISDPAVEFVAERP